MFRDVIYGLLGNTEYGHLHSRGNRRIVGRNGDSYSPVLKMAPGIPPQGRCQAEIIQHRGPEVKDKPSCFLKQIAYQFPSFERLLSSRGWVNQGFVPDTI